MAKGTDEITNGENIIDSRDVIDRLEYLADSDEPEEVTEREALEKLAEEAEGSSDWTYGEQLIRDSHFEDYARELAEETGMIKGDESWPLNCIDWEEAADQLKQDYFSVDFDGVDYWIRS